MSFLEHGINFAEEGFEIVKQQTKTDTESAIPLMCPDCKEIKPHKVITKQIRSGDEPPTPFATCIKCGKQSIRTSG